MSRPSAARRSSWTGDIAAEKLHNPIPTSDDVGDARGDSLFHIAVRAVPRHARWPATVRWPPQFMPPPDLLGAADPRSQDGYIYSYIRHGGVVMPSYGFR